jgi:tRNA threonylcarbamoyladenosine biosynthesis protein TsaE
MIKEIESVSEEQTEGIAADFAKKAPAGTVVALYGELGAGKTVFARGFARGLGVTETVSSPTFTIMQEYKLNKNVNGDGLFWFYHLDLYRIESPESALVFGVDEYLSNDNAVLLVEWAERIEKLLPKNTVRVEISHSGETTRKIRFKAAD